MNIIVLINMKKIFFTLAFLSLITGSFAANIGIGPDKFVQFYVSSLENREKATELNEFLKSKDGVKISRVDSHSKIVFVIFNADKNYTESDFTNWMNEKGYTFSCFNAGIQGVDKFIQLKAEDCAKK